MTAMHTRQVLSSLMDGSHSLMRMVNASRNPTNNQMSASSQDTCTNTHAATMLIEQRHLAHKAADSAQGAIPHKRMHTFVLTGAVKAGRGTSCEDADGPAAIVAITGVSSLTAGFCVLLVLSLTSFAASCDDSPAVC